MVFLGLLGKGVRVRRYVRTYTRTRTATQNSWMLKTSEGVPKIKSTVRKARPNLPLSKRLVWGKTLQLFHRVGFRVRCFRGSDAGGGAGGAPRATSGGGRL